MNLARSRARWPRPAPDVESTANRSKTIGKWRVCGLDAGKKVKGAQRHIVTDDLWPILILILVHTADIQDRGMGPV